MSVACIFYIKLWLQTRMMILITYFRNGRLKPHVWMWHSFRLGVPGGSQAPGVILIGWPCLWAGSCSSWVGQCFPLSDGKRVLKTLWMLRSMALSPADNWKSTRWAGSSWWFLCLCVGGGGFIIHVGDISLPLNEKSLPLNEKWLIWPLTLKRISNSCISRYIYIDILMPTFENQLCPAVFTLSDVLVFSICFSSRMGEDTFILEHWAAVPEPSLWIEA